MYFMGAYRKAGRKWATACAYHSQRKRRPLMQMQSLNVRPHEIEVHRQSNGAEGYILAHIENTLIAGALLRLDVHCADTHEPIRIELRRGNAEHDGLKRGDRVCVRTIKERVFVERRRRALGG